MSKPNHKYHFFPFVGQVEENRLSTIASDRSDIQYSNAISYPSAPYPQAKLKRKRPFNILLENGISLKRLQQLKDSLSQDFMDIDNKENDNDNNNNNKTVSTVEPLSSNNATYSSDKINKKDKENNTSINTKDTPKDPSVVPSYTSKNNSLLKKKKDKRYASSLSMDRKIKPITYERVKVKKTPPRKTMTKEEYRLSIEPKVYVPTLSRIGTTPKKIESERKRRIYSKIKLEKLLEEKGITPEHMYNVIGDGKDNYVKNFYTKDKHFLKIQVFDNEEFDNRTIHEWLNMDRKNWNIEEFPDYSNCEMAYTSIPIPAQGFLYPEWKECYAYAYNFKKKEWKVFWKVHKLWYKDPKITESDSEYEIFDDNDDLPFPVVTQEELDEDDVSNTWLPRIYIRFMAEDPRIFANRIEWAVKKRNKIESLLRYNLYIDCIPTDYSLKISDDTLKKIEYIGTRGNNSSFNLIKENKVYSTLINEIKLDYSRQMNKMLFDKEIFNDENQSMYSFLQLPKVKVKQEKIRNRVKDLPQYKFKELKQIFTFKSFLNKSEAVSTLAKVRTECERLASQCIIATNINKTIKLEEFELIQNNHIQQMKVFLHESWVNALKDIIYYGFDKVGKGWYNIHENNIEVYFSSKLQKFMTTVKFIMQDSTRYLVLNSLYDYIKFFDLPMSYDITVIDTNSVTLSPREDKEEIKIDPKYDSRANYHKSNNNNNNSDSNENNNDMEEDNPEKDGSEDQFNEGNSGSKMKKPLFHLDLLFKDDTICYSIDLDKILQTILYIFNKSIACVENIPQLEPLILKNISFAVKPVIEKVHEREQIIKKLKALLVRNVEKLVEPLREYAKLYEKYLPLLRLTQQEFIESYSDRSEFLLDDVERDYLNYLKEWNEIDAKIPSSIQIGIFNISCDQIKNAMKKDKAKMVINIFAENVGNLASSIIQSFMDIQRRVKAKPISVEELMEIREYIKTVPDLVKEQQVRIQNMQCKYEFLDKYKYNISNEDFKSRWNARIWPIKINEVIETSIANHNLEEIEFKKNLTMDQELFKERLGQLAGMVAEYANIYDITKITEIVTDIHKVSMELKECQANVLLYNSRENLLGLDVTNYEEVLTMTSEFEPYKNLWLTINDWLKYKAQWLDGPFDELNPEEVEKYWNDAWKIIVKSVKTFKSNENLLEVVNKIKSEIFEFKPYIPMIQALRNPGLRDRHWEQISKELKQELNPSTFSTLNDLIKLNVHENLNKIASICDTAGKEYSIQASLDKMMSEWENQNLEITAYKDTGTFIMKISDELLHQLEDHIVLTQSMMFSPYKEPFIDQLTSWETKIKTTQAVLDEWMACQRSWLYLEPIFSSKDIVAQLPLESKRFMTMNRTWRKIMNQANIQPEVIPCCSDQKVLTSFIECNKLLDLVSKGLSSYLERKRRAFPRFFFLSDDELLQILSQTKDPRAVQPHLRKCFENIAKLEFEDNNLITAMYSAEGERIPLVNPFIPEGNVEFWLTKVQELMKLSIREEIIKGLETYPTVERSQWVQEHPGQIVISVSQTFFTTEVTEAITNGYDDMKRYFNKQLDQLQSLVNLVRGELPYITRSIIGDLIVIDVHARDIMKKLIDSEVSSINDFEWMSQLRYYWENDELTIRIVNAEFTYGYEYLGNTGRLVITPLTDRCYLTLCGAMHLYMGGAPAGPAGTGKTETVKDLAKALAKQCVVFNCSDQLDYLAMEKFFKGLASAGAWACFDEFNRIDIEVLSVIAQQVMSIQKAAASHLETFIFEGTELSLDPTNAIFITMNPGYAGRTELPDNLKALFRPVAMMIPNYEMIAEISLFSFGFSEAQILAKKMVATFKLSSEQLSIQDHYDFGMRAVKTVISSAGNLKRENPNESEDYLLLRALCDVNLPKFLAEDIPLFNGIISDLFPGVKKPDIDYGDLITSLEQACISFGLQPTPVFIEKCIQMYAMTIVRHGLMLVGPTGGGKTCCYRVLEKALSDLSLEPKHKDKYFYIHKYVMNPKSITMGQLYGEFDLQTHEWTDGILPCLIRIGCSMENKDKHWYIFDGPVDAIWIESMNTVLDDNKKLCLTSGEIIKLLPTQTLIFEVENLAFASPATVSRCGMIYLEPNALGVEPLIKSWIESEVKFFSESCHKTFTDKLNELFETFLLPGLEFLYHNIREPVATTRGNVSQSLMRIFDCLISDYKDENKTKVVPASEKMCIDNIESLFIFSLIWSLGITSNIEGRQKFDAWLRDMFREHPLNLPLPEEGTVFDYRFVMEEQQWINWMNGIKEFEMPQHEHKDVIVPTIDTIRLSYLLELLIVNNYKTLCIGPTGTGKSVLITNKIINGMPTKNYLPVILNFSARTSANQTQDFIDSKLEKRRKNIYGPPINHKMIIFIDDLNMPMLDVCDSQPAIELIRQYLDHGGWYDRKNIGSFNELQDMILVCAMGLPGGGRNPITPRFTRHCNMISFTEMEDQSLRKIFNTILSSFMSVFPENISELCESLVEASIEIYNTIRKELLPTPAKSHYTFNLRDLSKVFKGMLDVGPSTILEPYDIVRLWIHECLRVFQDRLIDDIDRNWFLDEIKSVMYDILDMEYPDVVMQEPLIYGDYMNPNSDNKTYCEVKDLKKLAKVIDNYLEDYNTSVTSPMKLVLFLDAVEHISKICRIIRQPQGNALLLGVGGSGRQSLSKLAIFMEDYEIYQIELSKNYGIQEWHDDLKHIMMGAGLEEKSIVFLISDTQIVSETYFEDINNILNSGDVPNIYTSDEMDQIINNMRQRFPQTNTFIPTKENLFALYVGRVKKFLHLILCMSPMGESFTTRLRMFPSLVNCCTIDWFTMWPEEALQSVAANFISELSDIGDEEVMEGIVTYCVFIHESVQQKCIQFESELNRFNFVTPKSYLELLTLYKTLLEKKKNDLTTLRNRISTGLEKLLNATKEVQNLQEELKNTQPLLLQTSQEVEKTMKQISEDKAAAQVIRESVLKKEEFASNKAQETKKIADESQRDLDEALPALDAALESLNSLSKNDVIEVRSMQRPPEGVKLVIEAVCIMKGIKPKRVDSDKIGKKVDDYWDVGKALLADPAKFLDSLMKFDKDNISEQTILKIKPYIESPEFQVSVIAHVSKAAKSICQWVRAMEKYYWVAKAVAPKRQKLKEAQKILEETLASLAESKRELETVDNNIRDMEKQYDDLILKKEELKQKVDECNLKLTRAQKLITGLADERKRWSESVSGFDKSIENAVGDILIASGSIAYLGAFSSEYRAELIEEWMDEFSTLSIPHSTNVSLWDILGDPVLLRDWEVHGLPKDTFSRDNGLIIHHSQRWPLLIDPQGQANKWIRNMEKEKNIEIIKLSDQNYIRTLENAIRFGKPVLIENIGEKLDPALDPILLRQVYLQGGSQVIKLGDNVIPYHSDFKLYITTKLPNPHYTPEIYAMLTIVNFTLAPSGLEDQLLGIVVANERPDLEEIKNSLVISNAQMKKELKDIEDKILYLLSTVQGSPVDDERLIDTLAASKVTSSEIKEKVQEAEVTEKDIDITRNSYSAVAVRTRILFFCIVELSAIDPMYQYSLTWFLNLFVNSITNSEPSQDIEMRIANINDYFTFSLYTNICRSLFEKHKLMFSFLLTARILMNENKIDEEEYKFLITGTVSNKVELDKPNPAERWLTSQSWNEIQMLSSLKSFEGFDEEVTKKNRNF
jgi:dynein heavy chain